MPCVAQVTAGSSHGCRDPSDFRGVFVVNNGHNPRSPKKTGKGDLGFHNQEKTIKIRPVRLLVSKCRVRRASLRVRPTPGHVNPRRGGAGSRVTGKGARAQRGQGLGWPGAAEEEGWVGGWPGGRRRRRAPTAPPLARVRLGAKGGRAAGEGGPASGS